MTQKIKIQIHSSFNSPFQSHFLNTEASHLPRHSLDFSAVTGHRLLGNWDDWDGALHLHSLDALDVDGLLRLHHDGFPSWLKLRNFQLVRCNWNSILLKLFASCCFTDMLKKRYNKSALALNEYNILIRTHTWILIGYKFLSSAGFGLVSVQFLRFACPFQNKNNNFKQTATISSFHCSVMVCPDTVPGYFRHFPPFFQEFPLRKIDTFLHKRTCKISPKGAKFKNWPQ